MWRREKTSKKYLSIKTSYIKPKKEIEAVFSDLCLCCLSCVFPEFVSCWGNMPTNLPDHCAIKGGGVWKTDSWRFSFFLEKSQYIIHWRIFFKFLSFWAYIYCDLHIYSFHRGFFTLLGQNKNMLGSKSVERKIHLNKI